MSVYIFPHFFPRYYKVNINKVSAYRLTASFSFSGLFTHALFHFLPVLFAPGAKLS
jgi:hypothetical protein